MLPSVLYLLWLLAAFVVVIVLLRRLHDWPVLDRLLVGLVPVALGVMVAEAVAYVTLAPYFLWNDARLAPLIALTRGYDLYYGPDEGPILDTVYPPFAYLAYFPAVWAGTPKSAVATAAVVSPCLFFLPVLWLLGQGGTGTERARHWGFALVAFAFFAMLAIVLRPLHLAFAQVHADAPALGFAAIACALLLSPYRERGFVPALGALVAVLAVAAKQTMLPLLAALPIWFLLAGRVGDGLRLAAWLLLAGAGMAITLAAVFGPGVLYFNVVQVMSGHAWKGKFPSNLFVVGLELLAYCAPVLVLEVGYALASRKRGGPWSAWLADHSWTLLTLIALMLAPTSLLGRVKIGGDDNTLAPTLYFLLLSASLLLRDLLERASLPGWRTAAGVLAGAVIFLGCLRTIPWQVNYFRVLAAAPPTEQDIAFAYIQQQPGEVYFPNFPLAHLFGEGKLYHYDYGIIDRENGGFAVDRAQYLAHIPPRTRLLCFSPDWRRQVNYDKMMNWGAYDRSQHRELFVTGFVPVQVKELPGWECYERQR
jgi:hypothetical protein